MFKHRLITPIVLAAFVTYAGNVSARYIQADPIGLEGGMNPYTYADGNPLTNVDPNGLTSIVFDPSRGVMTVDPETKGRQPYNMPASTGRPNCGCDSSDPNRGPIPSGNYTIDTTKVQQLTVWQTIKRNRPGPLGGGDWGSWNTPLIPNLGTNTFNRSGFYMHEGMFPGSAGCIDVGGGMFGNDLTKQLLRDILSDPDKRVPVLVR
jgi:hypothetical protein